MKFTAILALLSATLIAADLIDVDLGKAGEPEQLNLKAKVDVTFPDNDSPLGVTVMNGHVTRINLNVENFEEEAITIEAVGGNLQAADRSAVLKNLTSARIGMEVASMQTMSVPYSFITNMHAQDAILELGMLLSSKGKIVQYTAYNGTISVADPETSLLDPQVLFLYLIIMGLVAGGGYLAYNTWVVPMMPKKKKVRTTYPTEARTSAVETPSKGAVDESWIPEHHLKRPVAQKVRSSGSVRVKTPKKPE